MKRFVFTMMLAVLLLCAAGVQAGQGGNCSPEGTWYGSNTEGALWIVTISRSGPHSYTTVMDTGANPLDPVLEATTDWRGELVKTGPGEYDWTTMAYLRAVEGFPVPYGLGYCPLAAEFTDCDNWEGWGTCAIYGFFSPNEDPFEVGFLLQTNDPLVASFRRMPMSYPLP